MVTTRRTAAKGPSTRSRAKKQPAPVRVTQQTSGRRQPRKSDSEPSESKSASDTEESENSDSGNISEPLPRKRSQANREIESDPIEAASPTQRSTRRAAKGKGKATQSSAQVIASSREATPASDEQGSQEASLPAAKRMLPERLPFDDLRDCMGPEHKLEFLYEACVALYSLALDLIVTYKDLSGKQQVNLRAVDEMRSNLQEAMKQFELPNSGSTRFIDEDELLSYLDISGKEEAWFVNTSVQFANCAMFLDLIWQLPTVEHFSLGLQTQDPRQPEGFSLAEVNEIYLVRSLDEVKKAEEALFRYILRSAQEADTEGIAAGLVGTQLRRTFVDLNHQLKSMSDVDAILESFVGHHRVIRTLLREQQDRLGLQRDGYNKFIKDYKDSAESIAAGIRAETKGTRSLHKFGEKVTSRFELSAFSDSLTKAVMAIITARGTGHRLDDLVYQFESTQKRTGEQASIRGDRDQTPNASRSDDFDHEMDGEETLMEEEATIDRERWLQEYIARSHDEATAGGEYGDRSSSSESEISYRERENILIEHVGQIAAGESEDDAEEDEEEEEDPQALSQDAALRRAQMERETIGAGAARNEVSVRSRQKRRAVESNGEDLSSDDFRPSTTRDDSRRQRTKQSTPAIEAVKPRLMIQKGRLIRTTDAKDRRMRLVPTEAAHVEGTFDSQHEFETQRARGKKAKRSSKRTLVTPDNTSMVEYEQEDSEAGPSSLRSPSLVAESPQRRLNRPTGPEFEDDQFDDMHAAASPGPYEAERIEDDQFDGMHAAASPGPFDAERGEARDFFEDDEEDPTVREKQRKKEALLKRRMQERVGAVPPMRPTDEPLEQGEDQGGPRSQALQPSPPRPRPRPRFPLDEPVQMTGVSASAVQDPTKLKGTDRYVVAYQGKARTKWSQEEEDCLRGALHEFAICKADTTYYPIYTLILNLYGENGVRSNVLANRNNMQLKDKARNIILTMYRRGEAIPYWHRILFPSSFPHATLEGPKPTVIPDVPRIRHSSPLAPPERRRKPGPAKKLSKGKDDEYTPPASKNGPTPTDVKWTKEESSCLLNAMNKHAARLNDWKRRPKPVNGGIWRLILDRHGANGELDTVLRYHNAPALRLRAKEICNERYDAKKLVPYWKTMYFDNLFIDAACNTAPMPKRPTGAPRAKRKAGSNSSDGPDESAEEGSDQGEESSESAEEGSESAEEGSESAEEASEQGSEDELDSASSVEADDSELVEGVLA